MDKDRTVYWDMFGYTTPGLPNGTTHVSRLRLRYNVFFIVPACKFTKYITV